MPPSVWAFGFTGKVMLANGQMSVAASEPLKEGGSMIVMCQFDKGIFTPAANGEGEFAEVRHKAFEGSDYQEELYREGAAVRHHMEAEAAVPDQRVTEAAAGAAVRHHVEAEATAEAVGVDLDENRILR